ncbi:MAG TPA: AAA family ATPase [Nitriliruptorales bacterium]|nr:AAA family ATPase [Nitriliruptorales bacterium]
MARTVAGPARQRRSRLDLSRLASTLEAIEHNVRSVVEGKPQVVRLAVVALLAEGHILIEDVPGVGKTLLAKALARSIDCSVQRIQFTPDLLPSDVTGVTVYSPDTGEFEFKPGPVFANVVLGDEINRAGPKTQSALLEAMEERTVTVDGVTYELGVPFLVMATQNPIELDGTYPLPEAQRDRFMMRLAIGYPDVDAELDILRRHGHGDRLSRLTPVADAATVAASIELVRDVHVAEPVERYIVALCRATRVHEDVELGASPRASLALLRAARALAATDGRDYATPDDVKILVPHVLPHRLILRPESQLAGLLPLDVVADVVDGLPAPTR